MKSGRDRKEKRRRNKTDSYLTQCLENFVPSLTRQWFGYCVSKHTKRKILRGRIAKRKSLMDWVTGRGVSEAGSGESEGVYCNVSTEESKGKQFRKSDDLPSPEFKNEVPVE